MGCDIHMYAEVKKDNQWMPLLFHNHWKDWNKEQADKITDDEERKKYWMDRYNEESDDVLNGLYDGRNYDLFAILADVRNGWGFAGCKTGEGFISISEPKGLPDDLSPMIAKEAEDWNGDGHSHSHFTLQELLDYPHWEETTKHYGWVTKNVYKQFKETNNPYPCCGDVYGGMVIKVSNEQMDKIISDEEALLDTSKHFYTQIEWETLYKDSVREFYTKTIPTLKERADNNKVGYDDIRIVFWFDN
jgi:hypothetical protein